MVRAIFQEGQIRLLDPFPEGWREGQELAVGAIDAGDEDVMDEVFLAGTEPTEMALPLLPALPDPFDDAGVDAAP